MIDFFFSIGSTYYYLSVARILEVEKKEQVIEESPPDSLKLEVAKDKNESKDLPPPAPEESQPETEQKIEESGKLNEPDDEETNSE